MTIEQVGAIVVQLAVLGLTALYLRGRRDGKDVVSLDDLAKANTRIADALDRLDARYRDHELDCSRWRATTDQILKQLAEAQNRMSLTQNDLSRRISNMALGLAPEAEARTVTPRKRG